MVKKNSIYDSMLGGPRINKDEDQLEYGKNETFNIMYQFKDEEPVLFYSNIHMENDFVMSLKAPGPNEDSTLYIEFTAKNGQTLKIYGIKNK